MLRELSIRELSDIEMDLVSGGEGDEDVIVVTGTRISDNSNPFAGWTGSEIANYLGLNSGNIDLGTIYINIPVGTGGGSTGTDSSQDTTTTTTTTTQPGDCTTEYHYGGIMRGRGTNVPYGELAATTTTCDPTTTTTTTQTR